MTYCIIESCVCIIKKIFLMKQILYWRSDLIRSASSRSICIGTSSMHGLYSMAHGLCVNSPWPYLTYCNMIAMLYHYWLRQINHRLEKIHPHLSQFHPYRHSRYWTLISVWKKANWTMKCVICLIFHVRFYLIVIQLWNIAQDQISL